MVNARLTEGDIQEKVKIQRQEGNRNWGQVEFEILEDILLELSCRVFCKCYRLCTCQQRGDGGSHSARTDCVTREQDPGQNSGKHRHGGAAAETISTLRKDVRGKRRGWGSEAEGGESFQEQMTHSSAV